MSCPFDVFAAFDGPKDLALSSQDLRRTYVQPLRR